MDKEGNCSVTGVWAEALDWSRDIEPRRREVEMKPRGLEE